MCDRIDQTHLHDKCIHTSGWISYIKSFGADEDKKSYNHAYEWYEESYTETDVLLNVGHANIGYHGSSVDEPIKPTRTYVKNNNQ